MKKQELPSDVSTLQQLLLQQHTLNEQLTQLVTQLQQQVEMLLHKLYGKKSERASKKLPELQESSTTTSAPKKKGSTADLGSYPREQNRRSLAPELTRHKQAHELPEAEKACIACGRQLQKIGKETTEQLEFIPAKLMVIQHVRYKYACSCCKSNVKIAPLPAQPIDKGLPGPGLLAEVLINKYEDALPLYRQEKRWERQGVILSRSTLCDWVAQSAQLLEPLVLRMREQALLASKKIHVDESTIPVLAKGKTHTGRLWVYQGGGGPTPDCTVYEYTKTRSQKGPQRFLENYSGYLQADAYAGYDILYTSNRIIEVACMAHARRKFHEVTVALKGKPSLADDALHLIAKLYEVERLAKPFSEERRRWYRKR